ncbi:unnamed protein product [Lampetra planeri]
MASDMRQEPVPVPATSELSNCQDPPARALATKNPDPSQPDAVKSPAHREHLHAVATANSSTSSSSSSSSSSSTSSSSSSSCVTASPTSPSSNSSGSCAQRAPDAARQRGAAGEMATPAREVVAEVREVSEEVAEVVGAGAACQGQRKNAAEQPPRCHSAAKNGCLDSPSFSSSSTEPSHPRVGQVRAAEVVAAEARGVAAGESSRGAEVSAARAAGVPSAAPAPRGLPQDGHGCRPKREASGHAEARVFEAGSRNEHGELPSNRPEQQAQQQLMLEQQKQPEHQPQQQTRQQQQRQPQQNQQQQQQKLQLQPQQKNQLQQQQQKLEECASKSREVGTMTSPCHTQQQQSQQQKRDAETQATQAAPSRRSVATSPRTPPSGTSPVHVYPEVNLGGGGGKKGTKATRASKKSSGSGNRARSPTASAAAGDEEEGGSGDEEEDKSPVREVRWDDKGMTWEVYGASMDVEVLGLAIQKHLEQQIEQHSRERSTRSDSTVAATQQQPPQEQQQQLAQPQEQQQQQAPPPPLQKQQQLRQASQAQLQPLPLQSQQQQQQQQQQPQPPGVEEAKGRAKRSRHSAVLRTVLQNVRQPRCCTRANSIAD